MDSYLEILKDSYNRVVELTLKDQSLTILSSMDNKSFYFSRIHQLFTELYSAERQKQIELLLQENQLLKIKNKGCQGGLSNSKIEQIQVLCKKCSREQNLLENDRKIIHQDRQTKKILHSTIKENQKLAQQLTQANFAHLQQIKNFSTFNEATQTKLNQRIVELMRQLEEFKGSYKKLRANYNDELTNLQQTKKQLQEQKEENMRQVLKISQSQKHKQRSIQNCERLSEEVNSLRQANNLLEDKIYRLQQDKNYLKSKLEVYEKQVNNISGFKQKQISTAYQIQINHQQDQDYNHKISNISSNLALKEIQIKGLINQKIQLEEQKSYLEKQFDSSRSNADKAIHELKQSLKKQKYEYETELRKYRQKQREGLTTLKKIQVQSKIQMMDDMKEKIRALQSEKTKLENKLMKLENTNQVLIKNYEQIAQAFKEQKNLFERKIQSYEAKLENSKRIYKQLTKKNQLIQEQYKNNEKQLIKKLKFYEQKIQITDQQLKTANKSQQNISKTVERLQVQLKNKSFVAGNQKLILRQHQLVMRVNQLQALLLQNKNASQSLIHRKQQRFKQMKIQLNDKCDRITQLEFKINNLIEEKVQQQSILKQTQKAYRQIQKKLVDIQERNRAEILQLMKGQEVKIQQITDNFTKHQNYAISKKSDNQKYGKSETLKALQKEYQNKINTLEQQFMIVKAKNIRSEQLIKQYQEKFKQFNHKLKMNSQQLFQLRRKQANFEDNLQKYKNKQVTIIKYYEQKLSNFKDIFRQFKYQICFQFKQAITQVKMVLSGLKTQAQKNKQAFLKRIANIWIQIEQRILINNNTTKKKLHQDFLRENEEKIINQEKQREHLINMYENKLKQKHMDLMTVAAEKQFMVQEIKQNQGVLSKKYKELQNMYKKIIIKLEKSEKTQSQLKNVILHMQSKVDEAEKNSNKKQKQNCRLQMLVEELTQKLQKSDNFYRKELKQCRQKYRQENQKIFNRYQKQFNKIIVLNSKKGKQKTSLTSISSMKGISIPTKGNQQDKVQKLKKQIQQQKRIVAEMENHKKF